MVDYCIANFAQHRISIASCCIYLLFFYILLRRIKIQ